MTDQIKKDRLDWLRSHQVEHSPAYPHNDIGAARMFFDLWAGRICYVTEANTWYVYGGRRWEKDGGALRVMELCKDFTLLLVTYAGTLDSDNYMKYAAGLCGRKRRESILKDACSIAPRSLTDFDRDKLFFNCVNGTFHLDTMTLQPHSSADYLTKLSGVVYDRDAICGRWITFIEEVMQGDEATARFLQKAFGYCLSGQTDQECFFILYGNTTRNGKSTACETVAYLLGDYACNAQPETLARRAHADGSAPSPDIARLKGARLVNMPEPERGLELSASLMKQLTGGDTYTGRFLHENPVEFTPEFKIFINTNHLPRVSDDTVFSSERVKLVPFERHFSPEEQDLGLKALFRETANISGIFNWLVEGYRLLTLEGLQAPDKVVQATGDYREESDILGTFFTDTLMEAEGNRLKTSDVYRRYREWATDNGYRQMNNKNFMGELRKRYPQRRNGRRGNEIVGVDFIPSNCPW